VVDWLVDFWAQEQISQLEEKVPEAFLDLPLQHPKSIGFCNLNIPSLLPNIVNNMVVVGRI
jgi:hypothetical protein